MIVFMKRTFHNFILNIKFQSFHMTLLKSSSATFLLSQFTIQWYTSYDKCIATLNSRYCMKIYYNFLRFSFKLSFVTNSELMRFTACKCYSETILKSEKHNFSCCQILVKSGAFAETEHFMWIKFRHSICDCL